MHAVCPRCGAINRVPEDRLAEQPVCGKCDAELLPAAPVALDEAALARYLERSDAPVIVDFWADWCGPCKSFAPHFAQVARERPGLRFVKVDSDRAPAASSRYGIRSIPTVLLFRGGREIGRLSGAVPAAQLAGWIDQTLARAG